MTYIEISCNIDKPGAKTRTHCGPSTHEGPKVSPCPSMGSPGLAAVQQQLSISLNYPELTSPYITWKNHRTYPNMSKLFENPSGGVQPSFDFCNQKERIAQDGLCLV